jgi:peptidoglycan/LPS O-acetylase OafA/YrhL
MPDLPRFPELTSIVSQGWVGVDIFFVLSGFVIAYSAEGSDAFAFFRSRFLRLMPAVWICASLVFMVLAIGSLVPFRELSLLYVKTLVLFPEGPWIDPVYWSLCIEVVFYGFILCLLLVNRFCQVAFFMGAIGIASALIWMMIGISDLMPSLFGSFLAILERVYSWKAELLLVRHGCLFALGVYLWLLMFKGVTRCRLSIASACFVGGFIEVLNTARDQAIEVGMNLPRVGPATIWAIFMIMIIASIGMNDRMQARAGWLAPVVRMLGLMTYPLYLIHQTVGTALMRTLYHLGMPRFPALFLGAAVCISISGIIATAFEPLFKQRLRPVFVSIAGWLDRNKRMAFLFQATTPVYESFPAAPAIRFRFSIFKRVDSA